MADSKLTAERAADIAKGRGLSLSDALALRGLTDDVEEAERLADRFASDPEQLAAQIER